MPMLRGRTFLLTVIACVSVGLLAGGAGMAQSYPSQVTIGVLLPLTGGNAQAGQNSLRGIQLVADNLNASGGIKSMNGATIHLVVRDSTSDPSSAIAAMQQLITSSHPLAIIGAYASSLTLAASPVSERAEIPLLTTSFADDLTKRGFKYIFRIPPPASEVGGSQMTYAVNVAKSVGKPLQKVAIIYENDAYGSSQAQGLQAQAKSLGLSVVLFQGYDKAITNATPLVQKIRDADPDALFPVSYLSDGVQIIRGLKSADVGVPVFAGVGGFVEPDFESSLGALVNGVFTADVSSPDAYGDFGQQYDKRYGTFMPQEAHDNGVLLAIVAAALEAHPTTSSADLGSTLHTMDFTTGLAAQMPGGHVKFDDTGANVPAKPVLAQWQDSNLVTVWPASEAKHSPVWP